MATKKVSGTAQENVSGQSDATFGPLVGLYAEEGQKYDPKSGQPPKAFDVVIIRPGESLNGDPFYKQEAINQAVQEGFWNGVRMFKDHSTDPRTGKPTPRNRRVDELVGRISTTRLGAPDEVDDSGNSLAGAAIGHGRFLSPAFASFAAEAQDAIGVSSAHDYNGRKYRTAGNNFRTEVDKFTVAHSVDWVPFPAAGGAVLGFAAESEGDMDDEIDWEKVADLTPDDLKSHAPALYEAVMASAQEGEGDVNGDAGGSGAPAIKPGMTEDEIKQLVSSTAQEAVTKALDAQNEKNRKIASAARQTQTLVQGAGLPPKTQARILAQFDGSEEFVEATVQEAITAAKEELAEFKPPAMRGLGLSSGTAQESVTSQGGVPVPTARSRMFAGMGIKPETAKSGEGADK